MRAEPPTSLAPAVEADLRAAVTRVVRRATGKPARDLCFHPVASASSHPVAEVRAANDGGTCRMLAKDLAPGAVAAVARGVKPRFVTAPDRERLIYARVLANAGLGTPHYHGATAARAGHRWLFLEYVPGCSLDQVGAFPAWEEAAAWAARFHARFPAERVPPGVRRAVLPLDRDWLVRWAKRAVRFVGRREDAPADRVRVLRRVARNYDRVAACILRWPASLTHGDYFPANVLIARDARPGGRVCPVDWELAGLGPGLLDLAAVAAGGWSDDQRAALAGAYYRALPARGRPAAAAFRDVFDGCRLHVAVQALGWADGWAPPAHQAHDWLGDVAQLADRLGL